MLRLFVLAFLGLLFWALQNADEMHRAVSAEVERVEEIHLEEVQVTSYTQEGKIETRISGRAAVLDTKMTGFEITPSRVEIFQEGRLASTVTSRVGRRSTPEGATPRFEFEGNVVGKSEDGRQLFGELLYYEIDQERLTSPQPATLISTQVRLTGDTLEANQSHRRGILRGNAHITYLEKEVPGRPPPEGSKPQVLEIDGDQAEFDLEAQHHRMQGDVVAERGTMKLRSKLLDFFQDKESLIAMGAVRARDGELEIQCEQLEYRLQSQRALARGAPRVIQRRLQTGEVQELTAREILASSPGKWIRGTGSVHLQTQVLAEGRLVPETDITADEVEAFYESGRATFRGNVEIVSRGSHAKGTNAVYYRDSRRVYVNGDAEAWEQSPSGQVSRRIRGEHILHYLDSGRSVVLGGVRGLVQDER